MWDPQVLLLAISAVGEDSPAVSVLQPDSLRPPFPGIAFWSDNPLASRVWMGCCADLRALVVGFRRLLHVSDFKVHIAALYLQMLTSSSAPVVELFDLECFKTCWETVCCVAEAGKTCCDVNGDGTVCGQPASDSVDGVLASARAVCCAQWPAGTPQVLEIVSQHRDSLSDCSSPEFMSQVAHAVVEQLAAPQWQAHDNERQLCKRRISLDTDRLDYHPTEDVKRQRTRENVQVIIRTKPEDRLTECLQVESGMDLGTGGRTGGNLVVDHIVGPEDNQEDMFELVGEPCVGNIMQGVNACCMVYGQTGSGKTHTMLGDLDAGSSRRGEALKQRGLAPRMLERLFSVIESKEAEAEDTRMKFTVRCSLLQVYQNDVLDMLHATGTPLQLHDTEKGVQVKALHEEVVLNVNDAISLLKSGLQNRKVRATGMNIESSRSHTVFRINVECRTSTATKSVCHVKHATLDLVDLAGSERQKKSGVSGAGQQEAISINSGLAQLGIVIRQVLAAQAHSGRATRAPHIAYRDSKLTFLLKDSLGGNAKAVLIATVSQNMRHQCETLSTLRFAQDAKGMRTHAQVNCDTQGSAHDLKAEISRLQAELSAKEEQLSASEAHERDLQLQLEPLMDKNNAMKAQLLSVLEHNNSLEAQLGSLMDKNRALEAQLGPLMENNNTLEAQLVEVCKHCDEWEASNATLQASLEEAHRELRDARLRLATHESSFCEADDFDTDKENTQLENTPSPERGLAVAYRERPRLSKLADASPGFDERRASHHDVEKLLAEVEGARMAEEDAKAKAAGLQMEVERARMAEEDAKAKAAGLQMEVEMLQGEVQEATGRLVQQQNEASLRQDPSLCSDVGALFDALAHQPPTCNLGGRTLRAPTTSSPSLSDWRSIPIWPHQSPVTPDNGACGLHTLACPPPDAVLCSLSGSRTSLENGTLQMGGSCIILDGSCDGAQLKDLTIEDSCIICHGGSGTCRVTFTDVCFYNCTLLVLEGAKATLRNPSFTGSFSPSSGTSLFIHGTSSNATLEGGTITKGSIAATVQSGGYLLVSDTSIMHMEQAGLEVKDEGSKLIVHNCNLCEFCNFICTAAEDVRGVHVHSKATAKLYEVTISGMAVAVDVSMHGSACLNDCTLSDTLWEGVMFRDGGTGTLDNCTVSDSHNTQGLCVSGRHSSAKVARCHFLRNGQSGMAAFSAGSLTADACMSSENKAAGFQVHGKGSTLYLSECTSNTDDRGCLATDSAHLTATSVHVSASAQSGFFIGGGTEASLQRCSATRCRSHGVYVVDEGSHVSAHACNVQQNEDCGVLAELGALVEVTACCSSRNKMVGYQAQRGGKVTVGGSHSNSDRAGCRACDGGKVIMEDVREDGVMKVGVLT